MNGCGFLNKSYAEFTKINKVINFHIHTVHLDITKVYFYSATNAIVHCLKNNFKIYIKNDIKTAPTCFNAITIIREHIIQAC